MPSLTTWAPFCGFAHVDNVSPCSKTITWLPLLRLQSNKPHRNSPEPSLWNPPEPASGTYTSTRRNSPEPASETYTSTRRNSPELSGTRLRNLHQHTTELSRTFRNPPPEPTPAHAGTLRNLPEYTSGTYTSTCRNSPEPSSGFCSGDLHRHTPELIWAENPISLRCWGINL